MYGFSKFALDWLCLILKERFGHDFILKLEQSNLKLTIAAQPVGYILFPKLEEAFHLSRSDLPCSQWDAAKAGWVSALGGPLTAPCVTKLPEPLIEQNEDNYVIHYDILGLTYWMLNRIEEIGRTDLDSHQRFPAIASHAYQHNYLERPVVDEWLYILGQVIQRTWPELILKQHQFSMKVSHDVDAPSRYGFRSAKGMLKGIAGDLVKRRDIKSALLAPIIRLNSANRLLKSDPYNTFSWIMEQSEKHELVSAFYFICGRTDPSKDADYEIEHPAIRDLMRRIHERGHEIGLHPSYNSFQSPEVIMQEAERLRNVMKEEGITQKTLGGRMHYLRWEHPTTLQAWNDAGMSYDSTLSYADRPGFRCGTCFEYPAFNTVTQQLLQIRIRPLIVMECSVMDKEYLGLGVTQQAQNKILELKKRCLAVSGIFTLLWHNSVFIKEEQREIYTAVLGS